MCTSRGRSSCGSATKTLKRFSAGVRVHSVSVLTGWRRRLPACSSGSGSNAPRMLAEGRADPGSWGGWYGSPCAGSTLEEKERRPLKPVWSQPLCVWRWAAASARLSGPCNHLIGRGRQPSRGVVNDTVSEKQPPPNSTLSHFCWGSAVTAASERWQRRRTRSQFIMICDSSTERMKPENSFHSSPFLKTFESLMFVWSETVLSTNRTLPRRLKVKQITSLHN